MTPRAIFRWFFPPPFHKLLGQARAYGSVSLQEVSLQSGTGWYASIRPRAAGKGGHAHRYSWTGQAFDIEDALSDALTEAEEFPIMIDMTENMCAPRLGGKEFDE